MLPLRLFSVAPAVPRSNRALALPWFTSLLPDELELSRSIPELPPNEIDPLKPAMEPLMLRIPFTPARSTFASPVLLKVEAVELTMVEFPE